MIYDYYDSFVNTLSNVIITILYYTDRACLICNNDAIMMVGR